MKSTFWQILLFSLNARHSLKWNYVPLNTFLPNGTFHKLYYTYIYNDPTLLILFNHYNRKYTIDELLPYIIEGTSFRKIKSSICRSIYKFHLKLVKFKIIEKSYELNVNKYLSNLETLPVKYYTDTTFVCNKLGEESVGYNMQIKKHKTTKISIITDDFNIPISVSLSYESPHDSTICGSQNMKGTFGKYNY